MTRAWVLRLLPRPSAIAAFLVAILSLAGIIHIAVILLVPRLATADGWSRLEAAASTGRFAELDGAGGPVGVKGLDPLFVNGACRLDLADAVARVHVEAPDRLWSLALYDSSGTIIFSLNDRTAIDGRVDMEVTAADPAEAGLAAGGDDRIIRVESRVADVIALLRIFAPDTAARTEARSILAAASCGAAAPQSLVSGR